MGGHNEDVQNDRSIFQLLDQYRQEYDTELCQVREHLPLTLINPLRMRSRVTVVCLSVCVSVTVLTARVLIFAVQSGTNGIGTILPRFLTRRFC